MVRVLCLSEGDANLRTREGYTPFMLSCMNGSFDCGAFIISRGGDPYLLTNNHQSCLSLLATAITQAHKQLEFAFSAEKMLEFAEQYQNDIFGDKTAVKNDIQILTKLVDDAHEAGYEMPAIDLGDDEDEIAEEAVEYTGTQSGVMTQESIHRRS